MACHILFGMCRDGGSVSFSFVPKFMAKTWNLSAPDKIFKSFLIPFPPSNTCFL